VCLIHNEAGRAADGNVTQLLLALGSHW
jgi:hypothetical protein